MERIILTFIFLILMSLVKAEIKRSLVTALEEKLENKFVEYANDVSGWLENLNDRHLSNSELGKMLNYNEIKPKLDKIKGETRSMKKMSMALLPIIFHVGATSTWLILTALMAAKSVAIGVILLVFKIAVSSAKVASFFTAWKHKHHHDHSWAPVYEQHHGHYRSFNHDDGTHDVPYLSYNPNWGSDVHSQYKTAPSHYVQASYPLEYEKEKIHEER